MIYKPEKDSYLLANILKKALPKLINENPNIKFLEIGAGSGIHLLTAEKLGIKKENIFSSDIDEDSINLNDFEMIEDASYDCFFINQYYECGDGIFHSSSIENETYLALANFFYNRNIISFRHENGIQQITSTEDDTITNLAITLLPKTKIIFHKDDHLGEDYPFKDDKKSM